MRLNKTLNGEKDERTPVWLMRQAGRYLPEYRALRASEPNFIEYCLNSEKAAEATLQPIDRYGFDAAIIFSDILMIPWAMGANVRFVQGEGSSVRTSVQTCSMTRTLLNRASAARASWCVVSPVASETRCKCRVCCSFFMAVPDTGVAARAEHRLHLPYCV